MFLSFEGIDGCGKSTLLSYLSAWLNEAGIPHIKTREPGGTSLGESLRNLLLDPSFAHMDPWTEALLYTAGRAQHVREVIGPALKQGFWVLSDRYVHATLAYQGYGRGLDLHRLYSLHEWSTEDLKPDLTLLLDCDVQTAFERRRGRSSIEDRLELQDKAFHERVRAGYLELAAREPERFFVLDSSRPLDEVVREFRLLFPKMIETEYRRQNTGDRIQNEYTANG